MEHKKSLPRKEVMVGRNDQTCLFTEALNTLAQVIGNQGGGREAVGYRGLERFQRNDPTYF